MNLVQFAAQINKCSQALFYGFSFRELPSIFYFLKKNFFWAGARAKNDVKDEVDVRMCARVSR